jgi:hypothetical protein
MRAGNGAVARPEGGKGLLRPVKIQSHRHTIYSTTNRNTNSAVAAARFLCSNTATATAVLVLTLLLLAPSSSSSSVPTVSTSTKARVRRHGRKAPRRQVRGGAAFSPRGSSRCSLFLLFLLLPPPLLLLLLFQSLLFFKLLNALSVARPNLVRHGIEPHQGFHPLHHVLCSHDQAGSSGSSRRHRATTTTTAAASGL